MEDNVLEVHNVFLGNTPQNIHCMDFCSIKYA